MHSHRRSSGRVRLAVAGAATMAVLGPLVWLWQASLLPETYSVMDMGHVDYGGGPRGAMEHAGGGASAHGAPAGGTSRG
jgi:hypothetical protein